MNYIRSLLFYSLYLASSLVLNLNLSNKVDETSCIYVSCLQKSSLYGHHVKVAQSLEVVSIITRAGREDRVKSAY